jgi:hypothetical protein
VLAIELVPQAAQHLFVDLFDCFFMSVLSLIFMILDQDLLGTQLLAVVEHSIYSIFYSVFSIFLPILLSPLEAFLAFA